MAERRPLRDPLVSEEERAHVISRLWVEFSYDLAWLAQQDDRDLLSLLSEEMAE